MAVKIFLAHAREDKAQVRMLYAELKARGLDPWLDEIDILPGQNWKEEIANAIPQAGVFLACLSSRAVGKVGYIQNEFRLALSAFGERPPGSIYLIPVRLDDCEVPDLKIPERGLALRDIQWVDLWQEGGLERLVRGIEKALKLPGKAPALRQPAEVVALRLGVAPDQVPLHLSQEPFRDCDDGPLMVVVPAGSFIMGSEDFSHEQPQHEVLIAQPFAVGKYEVTFDEWDACVKSGGCNGYEPSDERWGRGLRPVINVSWDDAQAYVAWLSNRTGQPYRLLSEAEWEFACRAGTTTRYSWGNEITSDNANCGLSVGKTTEVGAYPANPWGLHDMHGNVWEWVEDCWNESYQGAPSDGSAWTSGDYSRRVLRGGSWFSVPVDLRSACRNGDNADIRFNYGIGFRVARTLR
jgi:formylglycine-generating enzyme required for sulfatase activity